MPMSKVLKDLPICNNLCIEEAVRLCKEPRKMVQEMTAHLFAFTNDQIQQYEIDSIQLPYFGKFRKKSFKVKQPKHAKPI
jgi:hypothetical protein